MAYPSQLTATGKAGRLQSPNALLPAPTGRNRSCRKSDERKMLALREEPHLLYPLETYDPMSNHPAGDTMLLHRGISPINSGNGEVPPPSLSVIQKCRREKPAQELRMTVTLETASKGIPRASSPKVRIMICVSCTRLIQCSNLSGPARVIVEKFKSKL